MAKKPRDLDPDVRPITTREIRDLIPRPKEPDCVDRETAPIFHEGTFWDACDVAFYGDPFPLALYLEAVAAEKCAPLTPLMLQWLAYYVETKGYYADVFRNRPGNPSAHLSRDEEAKEGARFVEQKREDYRARTGKKKVPAEESSRYMGEAIRGLKGNTIQEGSGAYNMLERRITSVLKNKKRRL